MVLNPIFIALGQQRDGCTCGTKRLTRQPVRVCACIAPQLTGGRSSASKSQRTGYIESPIIGGYGRRIIKVTSATRTVGYAVNGVANRDVCVPDIAHRSSRFTAKGEQRIPACTSTTGYTPDESIVHVHCARGTRSLDTVFVIGS